MSEKLEELAADIAWQLYIEDVSLCVAVQKREWTQRSYKGTPALRLQPPSRAHVAIIYDALEEAEKRGAERQAPSDANASVGFVRHERTKGELYT